MLEKIQDFIETEACGLYKKIISVVGEHEYEPEYFREIVLLTMFTFVANVATGLGGDADDCLRYIDLICNKASIIAKMMSVKH